MCMCISVNPSSRTAPWVTEHYGKKSIGILLPEQNSLSWFTTVCHPLHYVTAKDADIPYNSEPKTRTDFLQCEYKFLKTASWHPSLWNQLPLLGVWQCTSIVSRLQWYNPGPEHSQPISKRLWWSKRGDHAFRATSLPGPPVSLHQLGPGAVQSWYGWALLLGGRVGWYRRGFHRRLL